MRLPHPTPRQLFVLALVFHAVYFASILDIYFRTPVIQGLDAQPLRTTPLAKRLVLFVGDGLRADTCFAMHPRTAQPAAPFLRSRVMQHGAWGVSHTRVPTESRPGHVALLAGMYEDVSAVTKGWKANPVEFDSVLNQSARAWTFGSPDILPIFVEEHDASYGHIHTQMYDAQTEDLAEEGSHLDDWVFHRVHELLDSAEANDTLRRELSAEKSVFFLHLLGLDTSGHAYRPHSHQYVDTLTKADEGIRRVVERMNAFFGDNETAFLFTSDHGMSDKGSHGDGDPDNTQTPFIAWGRGVRGPAKWVSNVNWSASDVDRNIRETIVPQSPRSWALDHLARVDVHQADLAPFMSALIGVPFPVNSVGVLPISLLDTDPMWKANALADNAAQIYAQMIYKANYKRSHSMICYDYPQLSETEQLKSQLESALDEGKAETAQQLSERIIRLSLMGLRYYHTYDRPLLMAVISIGYIGWIAFLFVWLTTSSAAYPNQSQHRQQKQRHRNDEVHGKAIVITIVIAIVFMVYFFIQQSPLQYFVYVAFPLFFWLNVCGRSHVRQLQRMHTSVLRSICACLVAVGVLQAVVYAFFLREVFVVILIAMSLAAMMWTTLRSSLSTLVWSTSCVTLAVCILIPTNLGPSNGLVVIGCTLMTITLLCVNTRHWIAYRPTVASLAVVVTAIGCVVLSMIAHTLHPFVSFIIRWCCWLCFVCALWQFRSAQSNDWQVWLNAYFCLGSVYALLSINYELIFFTVLGTTLWSWIRLEHQLRAHHSTGGAFTLYDLQTAVIYILLSYVGFFGSGNLASFSSFDIASTYRLISVFSPFVMMCLLVVKLCLPYALVTITFAFIIRAQGLSPTALLTIVIALTNVMNVNFLFYVRDEGSWRDIGMSISHFAIGNANVVLQLILFAVTMLLFRNSVPHTVKRRTT